MTETLFDSDFNSQVWEFLLSGGVFMGCILVCSLIAMAVALHRAVSLRWRSVIPKHVDQALESGDFRKVVEDEDSAASRIAAVALSTRYKTRDEAAAAVEAHAREEVVKLESGIPTLEVVIAIAPMLGLLGTVSGLVSVFDVLGDSGNADLADPAKMAPGIAKALTTTIAGLAVAVPVVIVNSFFTKRIESLAARLEVLANHLLQERFRAYPPPTRPTTPPQDPEPQTELPPEMPPSSLVQAPDVSPRQTYADQA